MTFGFLVLGLFAANPSSGDSPDVVELDTLTSKLACTEKIVVMREKSQGHYLRPANLGPPAYYVKGDASVGSDLYDKFADNYDILIYYSQIEPTFNTAGLVEQNASGLGFKFHSTQFLNIANRIKTTAEISAYEDYRIYQDHPGITKKNLKYDAHVVLHEIGHFWCCALKGFYENKEKALTEHWHGANQFFGVDSLHQDPMTVSSWIRVGEGFFAVDGNGKNVKDKFSPLSQYLMGLRSPEEVPPFTIHVWDTSQGVVDSKLGLPIPKHYGPSPSQAPDFLRSYEMTIEDVIRLNGVRKPSALESQKHFNALPIIIVPYGQDLDTGFVRYLKPIMDTLSEAWAYATDGRSTLRLGCDLFVGTRKPVAFAKPYRFDVLAPDGSFRFHEVHPGFRQANLELVDLQGRHVRTLYQGPAGQVPRVLKPAEAGGARLRAGTYLLRIGLDARVDVERIVLLH